MTPALRAQSPRLVDVEWLAKWLCNQYAVATHPQIAPTWETESELSKTLWRGNARALLAALPTVLWAMPTRDNLATALEPFVDQFDGNSTTRKYLAADAIMALLGKGRA